MTDHNPIKAIEQLSIPTHSYIAAAQAAGDFREHCDLVKYNQMITQISNTPATYQELPMAQMVFGYLVQEHVRNFRGTNQLSNDDIFILANDRASAFVKKEPWHWAEDATEVANDKVSNKEEAIRIMQSFPEGTDRSFILDAIIDELDVSVATAMSYIRSAVKDETVAVTVAPKAPKINKKAKAIELVRENPTKDKKTLIKMICDQLDTTAAGAQTYYYAAIKELNIAPTAATKRKNTRELVATIFAENPNISRIDFIEEAERRFDVQINTAQTYYYALVAEYKASNQPS